MDKTDPRAQPDPLPKARLAVSVASFAVAISTLALALSTGLPLSRVWWLLAIGSTLAVGLLVVYGIITTRQHTRTRQGGRANLRQSVAQLQDDVEALTGTIDPTHAWLFYELLVNPQKRINRITERVEPNTRSLSVRTTLSVSIPDQIASGTVLIPLLTPLKHRLAHGLRIYDSNETRVSSLTERKTIAYAAAVVRVLILAATDDVGDYVDSLELRVLHVIANEDRKGLRRSTLRELTELRGDPDRRVFLIWAKQLVIALSRRTPICIGQLVSTEGEPTGAIREVRAAVEQRLVAAPIRARPPRVEGKKKAKRVRKAARSRIGFYRWIVELLRSASGIRTTKFYFPLESADRASSYHLEFQGPDGTYLANQAVLEYPSGVDAVERNSQLPVIFQKRLGQRHAHLYVRGGRRFESRYVRYTFFERMPGSVGPAAVSAFAAWVVIWIAVLSSGGGFATPPAGPTSDLVAVLFAFPPIAAAWAGVGVQGGLRGGVLVARASLGVTILLSSLAALLYLIGPLEFDDEGWLAWLTARVQWGLVTGAATINFIAALGSWFFRALTVHVFIRRSQEV